MNKLDIYNKQIILKAKINQYINESYKWYPNWIDLTVLINESKDLLNVLKTNNQQHSIAINILDNIFYLYFEFGSTIIDDNILLSNYLERISLNNVNSDDPTTWKQNILKKEGNYFIYNLYYLPYHFGINIDIYDKNNATDFWNNKVFIWNEDEAVTTKQDITSLVNSGDIVYSNAIKEIQTDYKKDFSYYIITKQSLVAGYTSELQWSSNNSFEKFSSVPYMIFKWKRDLFNSFGQQGRFFINLDYQQKYWFEQEWAIKYRLNTHITIPYEDIQAKVVEGSSIVRLQHYENNFPIQESLININNSTYDLVIADLSKQEVNQLDSLNHRSDFLDYYWSSKFKTGADTKYYFRIY